MWFIKLVVDAVERGDSAQLYQLSLMVIGIFAAKYVFTRGQTQFMSEAANRLSANLRIRAFRKLQHLPISYFNNKRQGSIQSVLTNDVSLFQTAVTGVRDAIDGPIKVVIGTVTIFVLNWKLACAAILMVPVLAKVIQRNARKMKTAQAQVQEDLSNMNALQLEALTGTRVIQAFGAEDTTVSRFTALVERSFASQMVAVRRLASLKPLVELIGAVGVAGVVMVCAWLVSRREIGVGSLAAFLFSLDYINQGFRNLGALKQTTAQVSSAADRIYSEILDVEQPLADAPNAIAPEKFVGKIEFQNVSFNYPDGTAALKNLSFVIEPGTSLALVGPSGAGKSTIADLILRFYDPTEGKVLLDGVDLRELKTDWLRRQIGVVAQQTLLFSGTIHENILFGKPDATREEVDAAVRAAHATFVNDMPNGLETTLGERGVRLSGGEGQRISIARAFVRKPGLLLLDEATSNLDAVSEKAVQEALNEIMHGRTTVTIAHRLSTAARCTKVLMLRRGEMVEFGTFTELMSANGSFASMYRAYSEGLIDASIG
jgi:subfamily B ATP-binding cassette protein MsbA